MKIVSFNHSAFHFRKNNKKQYFNLAYRFFFFSFLVLGFGLFARPASAVLFFSDSPGLAEVVGNLTGLFLKILGMAGVVAFVIAGIMYLVSSGNQEKTEIAKRYLKYSILGLVVAVGSFVIIKQVAKLLG